MTDKPEEKWTEEEKKAAVDYKNALKTQEEEREKYKKVGGFKGFLVKFGRS